MRERAGCPFCEGRESATPPETFALAPPGRAADTPGWRVRVVPNKFPAFGPWPATPPQDGILAHAPALGRQEVVVHTPRHVQSFAELGGREIAAVAEAWRERARAAREEGFGYVLALLNEGRAAGASLAHSHSQLVWLADVPPAVKSELLEGGESSCRLCLLLAEERRRRTRIVLERDGLVLLCPYASRQPYELLVAPLTCEQDAYASQTLPAALELLQEALGRLHVAEGPVPVNAWLHTSAFAGPALHWHLEVMPRLSALAGLELGAELYVNTLPPEAAAGVLREA